MPSTRPQREAAQVARQKIQANFKDEGQNDSSMISTVLEKSSSQMLDCSNKLVNQVWYNPSSAAADRPFVVQLKGSSIPNLWTFEEADIYLGSGITGWLKARPMDKLDSVTAWRWGLCHMQELEDREVSTGCDEPPQGSPRNILRIVLGDGRNGFDKETYYASSLARGDGPDCFYKIFFCTLQTTADPGSDTTIEEGSGASVIFIGREPIEKKMDRIDAWARTHRGCILRVGPGSRELSESAKQYYVRKHGGVMCRTSGDNCAFAGVINALFLLGCGPTAKELVRSARPPIVRDFTDLSRWMREFLPEFQLLGGRKNRIKLGDVNSSNGVFLFRIVGNIVADHVVVVDGFKRLIYDSEEHYPLIYNHDSLSTCVGDDEFLLEVKEIRQLVLNM